MRNRRTWLIIAIIAIAAVAGIWFLRTRGKTSPTSSLTRLVAVERGDLTASISPTGQVVAQHQAQMSFDVNKITLLELKVAAGQQVKKGDVLARIDPATLQQAADQAEANLLSAADALENAQKPYTELDRQKAELDVAKAQVALHQAESATAEEALRAAEFSLESARLNLTITQAGTAAGKSVRDLQYTASWHARKLRGLQADLAAGKTNQETVDAEIEASSKAQAQLEAAQATARATLATAQDRVTQTEKALAELQAGSDALATAQARNKVAEAEYNLARAKDSLATIAAGPDGKTVQLAQARYDAAKATLAKAQAALDAATMVAPFDGTVVSTGAEVGDLVSSGTTIVSLADLTNLRVLTSIDETDISNVQVGQSAQITFDAFTGRKFKGKVLEIPLEGQLSQNVVTYQVPVSLEATNGVALKPGMTANVSIVVGTRKNALLVPVLAIQQADSGNVVMLQDAAQASGVSTPVELGLSDGTNVEVLRGLNEGDKVLIQYASTSTQQGGQGGGFGGFGIGRILGR
jgi:HlyD family secretion protein